MSLGNPSILEFMDRVKGDNPDWASLSNDEIKQRFTDARDNASGFGADIKRTASQAALDYIEEFEKNGGTAQDAIKKLDDLSRGGSGDTPLLKNGRINPEILDGAKPPEAAPSSGAEGAASNIQEPDVPPEPEIIVEAPEDAPSSGGDKTIADAIGSLSPEGQMQLMIGVLLAPIALLEGGDTLSNFLENMPPEIAEMLEQFIPPEMAEGIFGAVGLTGANVSVAGTGNMLGALRGDTPTPTPEQQPATVMQADLQQVPTPGYVA